VVDDNDTNLHILGKMLSTFGVKPALADSGAAALDVLKQSAETGHPFPLVILDAHMPDVNGFTLAQRITQDPQLSGARIMLLTSGSGTGDNAR
jgi:CheY-like chemotaxis protein